MKHTKDATRVAGAQRLTLEQRRAAEMIAGLLDAGRRSVTLGGLAGTGKTTVISQLHEVLGLSTSEIAYCAFTGKAATVINRKFPHAHATTIHSLIYRAREHHCKTCPAGRTVRDEVGGAGKGTVQHCHVIETGCPECTVSYFPKDKLPTGLQLIVVDEASMVPESIATHLEMYGVPIVWVGDHGQLPPVRSGLYLMIDPDVVLEKIHRHVADSPILKLAMQVRARGKPPRLGVYGDGAVVVRKGGNFRATLEDWSTGSLGALCATNATRIAINRAARRVRDFPQGEPQVGDRVICLRNNSQSGVYNGLTGSIMEIEPSATDVRLYYAAISLDGEDRIYEGRISAEQFNNPERQEGLGRKEADLWDYGYGLTVHKAQGSEYPRVVIVAKLGGVKDFRRWMYTAITRAQEQLEIIYPE